jgi:hypothetical protein
MDIFFMKNLDVNNHNDHRKTYVRITADFNYERLTAIQSGKPANYSIIDGQLISFTSNQIRGIAQ